jgi:hypothetical protein
MQQVLLIVGMHRSGTSACAGAVARLGLPLGEHVLPGQVHDNPKGFFEHAGVVAAHDELLASAGRTWDDPTLWIARRPQLPGEAPCGARLRSILDREAGEDRSWAVKDPRLCRLLPLWTRLLAATSREPRIILVHREPAAVAASLLRRDGFSLEKASLLWLDHVLGAERWSRGLRRAVVDYDELLRRPVETLEGVGETLAIAWPRSPSARRADIEDFLARPPAVGSSAAPPREGAAIAAATLTEDVWSELQGVHPALPGPETLDRLAERVTTLAHRADSLLVEHLGQVLERTVGTRLWGGVAPLEDRLAQTRAALDETANDLRHRLARLEDGLAEVAALADRLLRDVSGDARATMREVAEQLPQLCAELSHQGQALEATRAELGALGGEVDHVARELDRASREGQTAVTGQREALAWLSERVDRLEGPDSLGARLRAWWDRRRGKRGTGTN